eukprot:5766271-Amphidinium_carterae.1
MAEWSYRTLRKQNKTGQRSIIWGVNWVTVPTATVSVEATSAVNFSFHVEPLPRPLSLQFRSFPLALDELSEMTGMESCSHKSSQSI